MAVSYIPAMLAALVAQGGAALPDRAVSYGLLIADDSTPDVLMVGVDDPRGTTPAATSDAEQVMATLGTARSRDETGSITCTASSWNGDSDMASAVTNAFETFEAVASILRADPTLGVGLPGRVVIQIGNPSLSTAQFVEGAAADLTFTVAFKNRI